MYVKCCKWSVLYSLYLTYGPIFYYLVFLFKKEEKYRKNNSFNV